MSSDIIESGIVEEVADFVKIGLATAPPATYAFLGLGLDTWMFIMSILASLFYILDKLPTVLRRVNEWIKTKNNRGRSSNAPRDAS